MDGKLNMSVIARADGKSYLSDLYVCPPFHATNVGQVRRDGALYMMMRSSSPGTLNTDRYEIRINVGERAQLHLSTQSYQRLYMMEEGGSARQEMHMDLERGARLYHVPHPVVPHTDSHYLSHNHITLADDCEFMLGEIITPGRIVHRNEMFNYKLFSTRTDIMHKDKLIFKDHVLIEPAKMKQPDLVQFDGFTHIGTLIFMHTNTQTKYTQDEIIALLKEESEDWQHGISETKHPGFVLRVLARGAEVIYDAFVRVQELLWERGFAK